MSLRHGQGYTRRPRRLPIRYVRIDESSVWNPLVANLEGHLHSRVAAVEL